LTPAWFSIWTMQVYQLLKTLNLNIMKNLILFFLICIIATGAFLAGTTMKNPLPAFIVGFGVWMLFLYRIGRK
jgi:hypothetical protein